MQRHLVVEFPLERLIDIRTQGGNDEHTHSNARYVVMDTTTGDMEETCSRIADDIEQII